MTSVALVLVLATGIWGMWRDLYDVAASTIRADMAKFESHAERTVSRIESEVNKSKDLLGFVKSHPSWFDELWTVTVKRMPEVLYGAVLDVDNKCIESSDRLLTSEEGGQAVMIALPSNEHGSKLPQFPSNSLLLTGSQEAGDTQVLDFIYPIRAGSQTLGFYRVGMDYDQLQSKVDQARNRVLGGWSITLLTITAIVVGACVSLYRLGLHAVHLERQLGVAEIRRAEELHRLIVGLAHEVRNPLNAIRLNLFASKKILRDGQAFDLEDAANILDESVEEIERMDDLIGQLLGYARVVGKSPSLVDVNEQVDSVLKFFRQTLEQAEVHAEFKPSKQACTVSMDPQSLRQVLINLFQNACQAIGKSGKLAIIVSSENDRVHIEVHDSGPGLDESVITRIFEPFFSTREDGVGMGLAVVKGLVESSKGNISCCKSELLGGVLFRVELPLVEVAVAG